MKKIAPTETLHDQIFKQSAKDLPIGTGTGKSIDDPVKLFVHKKFGHTEADVISFSLRDYELVAWDVVKQETMAVGDKHIDYFELSISESPDDMKDAWKEEYYFDVTNCL